MSEDICADIEELGLYADAEGAEVAEYCFKLINMWEVINYSPFDEDSFTVAVESEIRHLLTWFKETYDIVEESETVKATYIRLVEK